MKQLELSCVAVGIQNGTDFLEKYLAVSYKVIQTFGSGNLIPIYLP